MITGIDYDNDVSSAVTSSVTTATSSVAIATTTVTSVTTTATTVISLVPVTVMNTAATTTTAVPIPVTTIMPINYITSIPNYHNVAMHHHPIVNDRLLMFRKLTWIQRVKLQMYEVETWSIYSFQHE